MVLPVASWMARWNFDKGLYQPRESGFCHFWLENTGADYLYAEKVWLQFDWQREQSYYRDCCVQIPPKRNFFLTSISFNVPQEKAGQLVYAIGLELQHYDQSLNTWSKLETWWTKKEFFINSIPLPYFKAFISRGVRPEDRVTTDPIAEMIKDWGFQTTTIGIERMVDTESIDEEIKNEIRKSDCFIAIATGRYIDAFRGMWRTLEYLHGETGIAFGLDKPLLFITEQGIIIEGLPGYLIDKKKRPSLVFDPLNIQDLRQRIDYIMPSIREWISNRNAQEFWNNVGRLVGPFIIGLLIGGIFLSSTGSSEN